jgi:hypothetical protein
MDYVCGPVILFSQDKVRMMDFLSDVFEFDVDPEEDLVLNGTLNLKLIELPENEKENFQTNGIKFAFKIKHSEEINKIVDKYNFFLYRKADTSYHEEICKVGLQELTIKDIDGRIWQFDVESDL